MAPRYKRALSPEALNALLPGASHRFLIPDLPLPPDDPYALDIQLRENNTLMYYRGTTRLLTIQMVVKKDGIRAVARANKAYGKIQQSDDISPIAFREHLSKAAEIEIQNRRYYSNKKEGYWQNRLCIKWGRQWTTNTEFMSIDRECVVGFDSGTEKDSFYNNLLGRYDEIRNQLQETEPDTFGIIKKKAFGDELDILAVDKDGNLVVIELKHRSNTSGIYWGPLQVMVYRDAFRSKLAEITSGIKELVTQKVTLGLLPKTALSWLPVDIFPAVKAVLVVSDPNAKSNCWKNLKVVLDKLQVTASSEDKNGLRFITLA